MFEESHQSKPQVYGTENCSSCFTGVKSCRCIMFSLSLQIFRSVLKEVTIIFETFSGSFAMFDYILITLDG